MLRREGGKEREREGGREGRRERGKEREMEGGREGEGEREEGSEIKINFVHDLLLVFTVQNTQPYYQIGRVWVVADNCCLVRKQV